MRLARGLHKVWMRLAVRFVCIMLPPMREFRIVPAVALTLCLAVAPAQALIDAEAPSGTRREQMVAGFNRGYRGFQQTYRNCTPAADIVVRRYLEEGAKIARDITARYAN